MKTCTKCGETKPFTEFYKRKGSKDGYRSDCKSCRRAHVRQYYQENKEKVIEYNRWYKEEHKEERKEYNRRYNQENKEKIAEKKRRHREQNKEAYKEYHRLYREKHRETLNENRKQYYEKKNSEQSGCVYQIVNTANQRMYIGQTTRGELRWDQHLRRLRGNYHGNPNLQADFDKFGADVFEWSIIQELPKDKEVLEQEEKNTIQRLLAEGKELYNIILN